MKHEIQKHEELKNLAIYSYNLNNKYLPKEYHLEGISSEKNGFFACVLKKDKEIVIVFRGTELSDNNDLKDDLKMYLHKMPSQAKSANNLYNYVKKEYPNHNIVLVGHSLGGSLAQIIASIYNLDAITFNAFGIGNILKDSSKLHVDKIINYCNPDDPITTMKKSLHIGKCYFLQTRKDNNKFVHFVESMETIDKRIMTAPKSVNNWKNNHTKNIYCTGTYKVNGYIKENGTRVNSYIRTCGVHNN